MTRDLAQERPLGLHPPLPPYEYGWLDVGDGHSLYWEACGNRSGVPAVFLHGGPGGGCSPDHRRFFNPDQFDILLFDQRGCGRSRPHGSIEANTTAHLIDDLERLRKFRNIENWLIVGGSWGSALALAYAEQFPERVTGLVLRGIFTARASELRWLYQDGASHLFPEAWSDFVSVIPASERSDLIGAYNARLDSSDPAERRRAAQAWCAWESATITLRPRRSPTADLNAQLALARLETHYFVNGAFLREGQLIEEAHRLAHIPGVLVQGRYDCVTPPKTAVDLQAAWPGCRLHLVPDAGHASSEPGVMRTLMQVLEEFAQLSERKRSLEKEHR